MYVVLLSLKTRMMSAVSNLVIVVVVIVVVVVARVSSHTLVARKVGDFLHI
jgi:hypothetical protein